MSRIVCHFSCGAASAVATKLTLCSNDPAQVEIFNAFVKEEHSDGRRFLADCEKWFAHPVTVLRDTKYGASAREVWRKKRFIKQGIFGAACSTILKREVIEAACLPDDVHVFGFTDDARDRERAQRFLDTGAVCPLIERGLKKADCLAIIERAGIELPLMYRLGFNNNNCIGCCKGGEGYFDKVREHFPADFEEFCQIEESIGPNARIFRDRETGERFPLRSLPIGAGRHDITVPDCGLWCEMAEQEFC